MKAYRKFKKQSFICILTLVFFSMLPLSANAILISTDFLTGGDQLLTFDTETGYEWLDLSQTLNMSFNEVMAGVGGFTNTYGFHYATNLDVLDLIDNAGGDNPAGITNLLDKLGCTINCSGSNPGAFGIVPETAGLVEYSWFLVDGANSDVWVPGPDGKLPETGSLLLRSAAPVPEPATMLLLGTGTLGLLGFRRRKKK